MKALRTAAFVVGAAALIATGVGAVAGAGTLVAGTLTVGKLASITSAVSAGLQVATAATTPKGTIGGNATAFKIDKEAGIPIMIGRSLSGGNVLHRQYYDDPGSRMRNQRESWVTAYSLGPVQSMGPLLVDKVAVAFNASGAATGFYAGNMWLDTQRGLVPEARALRAPTGYFPGWTAASKLSGLAADLLTLDFDSKGKKFPNGVPQRARVIEGVYSWDPRLDSTYPGGSGPCRLNDPSTHVYSENPWIHALQHALGRYQNGTLIAGGGMKLNGIIVQNFVNAANVADANGWKAGGTVYATADNDWDILVMLAQAGGGEVFSVAGQLSCTVSAPKVSIGTITWADIIGDVIAPTTASKRVRRNTIIPRVRLESHGWAMTPLTAVKVDEYIALDGAPRPREIDYPLVQQAKQGAELATYFMMNAREIDGIVLPCNIAQLGYLPGDCVTLDIPQANLVDRDVEIRTREMDPGDLGVTFSARTETAEKHPYALGKTTTPPPTPDLSVPSLDLAPPQGWSATAAVIPSPGVPMPVIVVTGEVDNALAQAVQFDYRVFGTDEWMAAGSETVDTVRKEITSVVAESTYEVSVRYRIRGALGDRAILGPVTIPEQPAVEGPPGPPGPPGPKGDDGVSAYAILLTNENHILPADADGNVITYNGAATDVVVYSAGVDVTDQFALSVGDNPQGLTVGVSGRRATVTGGLDQYEPNGVITLSMTGSGDFAGVALEKVFSLTKSRAGADGSSPPLITIEATNQIGRFDTNGAFFGGPVTFDAIHQSVTGNSAFSITRVSDDVLLAADTAAGLASGSPAYFSTTGPFNLTLSALGVADYLIAHGAIRVTAYSDGTSVTDSVTIIPVRDGARGEPGLPGAPGADGQTWYPYYAYANSPDGFVDFTTGAPGNRAYVGFASGTSPTEPTLPGLYAWSEYKGPPFGLATTGPAYVAGSSIIRNGGTASWEAQAYSTIGYRNGATTSFRGVGTEEVMAGLTTDPTASVSFDTIDHAWYLRGDGQCAIYENGALVWGPGLPGYGTGAFTVDYDNRHVRYFYQDTLVREIEVGPGKTFYFDSSFGTITCRLNSVQFSPRGAIGADGADAPLLRTQWSIDGATNWHDHYFGGDRYYRQSNDGGATWGPAILGVGENGAGPQNIFRRSATVPATPGTGTGNPPPGWGDGPPAGTDFLWLSTADYRAGAQVTPWSAPQRISGDPGSKGDPGDPGAPGTDGVDGQDGYTARLTAPAIQLPAFANGDLKPGALANAQGMFQVLFGATDVSSGATFVRVSQSGGTATIDAAGSYAVTSLDPDQEKAEFVFRATLPGIPAFDQKLIVTKVQEGAAGYSRQMTGPVATSSTTYAVVASISGPTAPSMGVAVSYGLNYQTSAGTGFLVGLLQYRVNSGAWTDLGSEVTGSVAAGPGNDPGTISLAGFVPASGIPNDATIELRVQARKGSGGGGTISGNGRIAMSWRAG